MATDSRSFLRQIYPREGDADDAEVDLVAVHGLDPLGKPSHAYNTWTHEGDKDDGGGKLWLRDFLPTHPGMPKLRVLLFGYDSSAAFKASTVGVAGASSSLLEQLRFKRLNHQDRPIVFVCHSLGGIVVKQALVEAHNADEIHGPTLNATKGIAFFATPHQGGHGGKLGDAIVHVLRAFTGNVRNDIMENLRKDSFLSNHLQQNFARRAKNLRVVNFIETLPITDVPVLKSYGLVVPRTSSVLGWSDPEETQVLMEASHTTICKFPSNTNELYLRVADHMAELFTWVMQSVVPVPLITTEDADLEPPPPYASLMGLPKANGKGRRASDNFTNDDSSDGDEMSRGWLDRIRSASPFRSTSPTPANMSRNSSSDSLSVPEAQITWPIVMLPYRQNQFYVNRSETWQKLVAAMNQGTFIVLNGFAGSGKTQITIHLIHWFRDRNPDASIMWVHASSPEACLTGLQLIALRVGMPTTDDGNSRLIALKDYLEHPKSGRWLLAIDSADDLTWYDIVSKFIPRCTHGQVVVTSRRRPPTSCALAKEFVLEVSTVSGPEGVSLVRASLRSDLLSKADALDVDRLLKKLDFLPLAISQAVAFMNKHSVSIAFYLTKISDDAQLSEQLSRNHIAEKYTSGAVPPLLGWLSFLEAKLVPIDLVRALCPNTVDADVAIVQLEDYSFVELSEDRFRLSLHRLLQLATQRWLEETSRIFFSQQHVLFTLSQYFPDASNIDQWPYCEAWLPHATKHLRLVEGFDEGSHAKSATLTEVAPIKSNHSQMDLPLVATLKMKLGHYHYQIGEYPTARQYLEEAFEFSRHNLGTMHDLALETQEKLIHTLRYLDHLRQAATLAKDLKRARKAKLGRKHRITLESYRIYALTLEVLGKWQKALDASEKALKGYRELYKNDLSHLDVLRSCRRTATCCVALGYYDRAETLLGETLQGSEQRSGSDTVVVVACLYTLARLQADMDDFVESETNARKAHDMRQRLLKKGHPDTLKAQWAVSTALTGQKQWEPALEILQQLLAVAEMMPGIGKTHNYWYALRYSLATLQEGWAEEDDAMLGAGAGQQRLFEARATLEAILKGRIIVLGGEHLDTLATEARLASVDCKVFRFDDGERASQEVLQIVTSKLYLRLGIASARIAWTCLASLRPCAIARAVKLQDSPGTGTQAQQPYKLACRYARTIVEGREKMLGPKQPHTLAAARDYTDSLHMGGDDKTANKIRQTFGISVAGLST